MRLVGQVVQCLTPPWQLHVRCPLYAATLLGHLIQLDAAMPGSSLYQVTGVVLTVAQVVLPTLCLWSRAAAATHGSCLREGTRPPWSQRS